ncbi:unnamed protein product [Clonostachys rhizophaga]|uniref:Uncharacterized protein n=1 Tax=Clonostachys rhizophaga TaxID=160324 RepID=A0A9N9VLQ9_9HYPO|nr:unnamed protein product [Clonostachys rhizophaga]
MVYLICIPSPFATAGFIDAQSGELSSNQAMVDKEPSTIYNPHFSSASNDETVNDQASPPADEEEQDEDDSDRLFHIVTPDPEEYSPVTHSETKESYYFLKLGRGRDYDDYQEARRHNPVISIVVGDIPQAEEEEEEEGKPDLNEWYKVIPKSEDELEEEYEESEAPEAWTHDDLRSNLIAQQRALANEENEEYEQLMQQLLEMCNIRHETDIDRQ